MPSYIETLYEDNHLIAVFKPAGLLTQGDISGDVCLMDLVKTLLKEKYAKPGQVFLGLIHRLDRPVSGVVLFAKTSKGASRLSEQFRSRDVRKVYQAVVEGKPPRPAGELVGVVDGKPANLHYKVMESGPRRSLLEIELGTGRKHQIRIQLSEIGCPVAGDRKYGAKDVLKGVAGDGTEIGLVARRIEFFHPVRREERIVVEVPERLCPLKRFL